MANLKSQRFIVIPDGLIKGGYLAYIFDRDTGELDYEGKIVAGKFLFKKTIPFEGHFKVEPKSLVQSAGKNAGDSFNLGPLSLQITSMDRRVAICHVSFRNGPDFMTGIARVDMTEPYISITTLSVAGKIAGHDVKLRIEANK